MGLWDNVYLYAAVIPGPMDDHPWKDLVPYTPPQPLTPERAKEAIESVMRKLDEFDIMRAIAALDKPAQERIRDWLTAMLS